MATSICFLLNHSDIKMETFKPREEFLAEISSVNPGDRVYRNEHGKVTDITREEGDSKFGYRLWELGIVVSDVNFGWYSRHDILEMISYETIIIHQSKEGTVKDDVPTACGIPVNTHWEWSCGISIMMDGQEIFPSMLAERSIYCKRSSW